MKAKLTTLTLLTSSALLFSACGDRRSDDVVTTTPATTETAVERDAERAMERTADATREAGRELQRAGASAMASVSESFNNAGQRLQAATYDERTELRRGMNTVSSEVEQEVKDLERDAQLPRATRDRLTEARRDFDRSMERLADASRDNWDDAKRNANQAWDRLRTSLQDARTQTGTAAAE